MKTKPLILRNKNFRLLWISQVVSQAGSKMFAIAVMWWLLTKGMVDSGLSVGLFLLLGALPAVLLAKWIGNSIDQNSSKKILVINDSAGILLSGILLISFMTNISTIPLIFISSFLFALFFGFIDPTLQKAIPELVEEEDVGGAVALMTSTSTFASLAGALFGALLIEKLGIIGIVVLNGASYLISIACDGFIEFNRKSNPIDKNITNEKGKFKIWSIFDEMPLVKKILLGFGMVNFFGTPLMVVLPLYTKNLLNGNSSLLALFEAAITFGMIIGIFSSKYIGLKKNTILLITLLIFAEGLCLIIPGIVVNSYIYGSANFILGFVLGILNVRMITFFQETVKNELKGRFFALLGAICSSVVPIGFFLVGLLADFVALEFICISQGVGLLLVSIYYFSLTRKEKEFETYKLKELIQEGQ